MRAWLRLMTLLTIVVAACGGEPVERASQDIVYGTPTPIPQATGVPGTVVVGELVLLNNFARGDGALRLSYPGGWLVESTGDAVDGTVIVANTRAALRGELTGGDAYQLVMRWAPATAFGAPPDTLDFDLGAIFTSVFPDAQAVTTDGVGAYAAVRGVLPDAVALSQAAVVDLGGGVVATATAYSTNLAYENMMARILAEIIYGGPRPVQPDRIVYYPVTYRLLHENETVVQGVAFDNRAMYTWDFGGQVVRWNLDTGTADYALSHGGRIAGVALLADGLLVLPEGQPILYYDARQGTQRRQYAPDFGRIDGMALSPNGRLVAGIVVNNQTWNVHVWEVETGALVETLRPASGSTVTGVVWDNASSRLVLYGSDGQARVYALAGGQRVLTADHTAEVLGAAWSPDDRVLATVSRDNYVDLWATSDNELLQQMPHTTSAPVGAIFSADGGRLVAWQSDRVALVWDVATGQQVFAFETFPSVGGAFFTPDQRWIVSWVNPLAQRQETHLVDAATGSTVLKIPDGALDGPRGYQSARAWLVVSFREEDAAALYAVPTETPLAYFQHTGIVAGVLHPRLPVAVTYGDGGVVQVYGLSDVAE